MDFQLNLASETVAGAHPQKPLIVAPTSSVCAVLEMMREGNYGSAMICSEDQILLGIFTERDLVKLLAAGSDLDVPIERVMVRDPVSVKQTDTVGFAIAAMAKGGYRRLPVIDENGHPIGVLGVSHVLEFMVDHFPKVYTLPPQPNQSLPEREGA